MKLSKYAVIVPLIILAIGMIAFFIRSKHEDSAATIFYKLQNQAIYPNNYMVNVNGVLSVPSCSNSLYTITEKYPLTIDLSFSKKIDVSNLPWAIMKIDGINENKVESDDYDVSFKIVNKFFRIDDILNKVRQEIKTECPGSREISDRQLLRKDDNDEISSN